MIKTIVWVVMQTSILVVNLINNIKFKVLICGFLMIKWYSYIFVYSLIIFCNSNPYGLIHMIVKCERFWLYYKLDLYYHY